MTGRGIARFRAVRPRAGGFTTLEILLVIALIALLSGAIIGVSSRLLNRRALSADEVFWKATQAARKTAVLSGHDVRVSFDPKTKAFELDDGNGVKAVPVPGAADDLAVEFLSAQSGGSVMLLGGTVVGTQTVPFVTFFADGTCVPFRVQIRNHAGAHVKEIDEWTCAQILTPPNPNGLISTP